jgi:hypothetical protein
MVIPLLDAIAIQGKTITVDAFLTQRKFAEYVVNREAVITSPSKITSPRYVRILPCSSRTGKNPII